MALQSQPQSALLIQEAGNKTVSTAHPIFSKNTPKQPPRQEKNPPVVVHPTKVKRATNDKMASARKVPFFMSIPFKQSKVKLHKHCTTNLMQKQPSFLKTPYLRSSEKRCCVQMPSLTKNFQKIQLHENTII